MKKYQSDIRREQSQDFNLEYAGYSKRYIFHPLSTYSALTLYQNTYIHIHPFTLGGSEGHYCGGREIS